MWGPDHSPQAANGFLSSGESAVKLHERSVLLWQFQNFILGQVVEVTGGTGWFAGARGSFTLQRVVSLITGVSTRPLNGTMLNPGKS